MATWPTTEIYKAWARVGDAVDDAPIAQAVAAANAHVASRCTLLEPDDDDPPEPVVYACLLLTNRLLARRNSPEGVIGSFDGVVADIGRADPDAWRLIAPYVAAVIA